MYKKIYSLTYASLLLGIEKSKLYQWNSQGKIRLRDITDPRIGKMKFITHEDFCKLRELQISKGFNIPEIGSNPSASRTKQG